MIKKYRVVQLVASVNKDGGPQNGLNLLINSDLKEKYDFIIIGMPWAPHGLSIKLLLEWKKRIKKENPDLVHVRGLQSEGFYGLLAAKLAGCEKNVLSIHGFYSDLVNLHRTKKWVFMNIIEPITLLLADKVYCVCKYAENRQMVQKYAKNLYGTIWNAAPSYSNYNKSIERKKVREELNISDDKIVVLSVGRMTYDKGLDILQEVIMEVLRTNNHIDFLIVGDGEYKAEIERVNMSNRIHLIGSQKEVGKYYMASDIFISTSRHENLSNSLLEASEAALAIITTGVGGNAEVVINGETGTIIPSENIESAINALLLYTDNASIRITHGNNAQARVRTYFSQKDIFNQIDNIYSEMLCIDNK